MTNRFPPAEPGDLFILLAPAAPLTAAESAWLEALATRFGGRPLDLIHVSCQRFFCADSAVLASLQRALRERTRHFAAIAVVGLELLPLYSPFHEAQLLKCRVQVTPALEDLDAIVERLLREYSIQGQFPALSDLVTLLQGIDPLPPEPPITSDDLPRRLFLGDQLMISRISAQRTFEILAQWQLK